MKNCSGIGMYSGTALRLAPSLGRVGLGFRRWSSLGASGGHGAVGGCRFAITRFHHVSGRDFGSPIHSMVGLP